MTKSGAHSVTELKRRDQSSGRLMWLEFAGRNTRDMAAAQGQSLEKRWPLGEF